MPKSRSYEIMESHILHCDLPHTKSVEFTVKAVEDKADKVAKITGYASVFENKDLVNDVVKPGAFKKTIIQNKGIWPIFMNHNKENQVGINVLAKEDSVGLKTESALWSNDDAIPKAKEAVALLKKNMEYGRPMGLSIGGMVKKIKMVYDPDAPSGERYTMEIYEFQMLEHSITAVPANQAARVTNVKSLLKRCSAIQSHPASKVFLDFSKKFIDLCD